MYQSIDFLKWGRANELKGKEYFNDYDEHSFPSSVLSLAKASLHKLFETSL